jgi:hypothetical protein
VGSGTTEQGRVYSAASDVSAGAALRSRRDNARARPRNVRFFGWVIREPESRIDLHDPMLLTRKRFVVAALFVVASTFVAIWLRRHLVIRLELDDDVQVALREAVPFRTAIEQRVDVTIDQGFQTKVKLGEFAIDLNERVDIPLRMKVEVPIDSSVRIDQPLDISIDVPIDTVLSEKELDLNQLTIPIDQNVFIDDTILLDIVVPIDTTVTTTLGVRVPVKANLPIKMKVPIKQPLHVRDSLKLKLRNVRVPLKMVVPVHAQVPLNQSFRVRGSVTVPIDQTVQVPIRKTIRPSVSSELPVSVVLSGKLPALIKAKFDSAAAIDGIMKTRLGPVQFGAKHLTLHLK